MKKINVTAKTVDGYEMKVVLPINDDKPVDIKPIIEFLFAVEAKSAKVGILHE